MSRSAKVVLVVAAVLLCAGVVWKGGGWLMHKVRVMHGAH